MLLDGAILAVVVLTGLVMWSRPVLASRSWRAVITPLASIIGSGFLVLGPILQTSYGMFAPLVMAGLCLVAYLFGAAIRFNIATIDNQAQARGRAGTLLESAASATLGFAYMISVAYYLNLFGAFGLSLTPANDPVNARLLTTAVFAVILFVGWTRGFRSLENMEYVSVTLKLAIIAGLLLGMAVYFAGKVKAGGLVLTPPEVSGWAALTIGFGLIVTVQGFETSRYLGDEYDPRTRIRSMHWAQWLSSAIYMTYILLLAYVFELGEVELSETAIVGMMEVVAPILPLLLVAAALAAQFSAAVADTGGSGGLIAELSGRRVSPRQAYAILTFVGVALTWSANVFEIISYASRAFAAYYALQALIAALAAHRAGRRAMGAGFGALAVLGLAIAVLGQPVEG